MLSVHLLICPAFSHSAELSPEYSEIVSLSIGSYHSDDKQLLAPAFIKSVNTLLRRYEPELISQDENGVRMRASYRSLYDIELAMDNGTYQISARLAKKVLKKDRAKSHATNISTGLMKLVEQELTEPKRVRQLEQDKQEQARRDQEQARRNKEREEQRLASVAAAILEDKERMAQIKQLGHLRAYPALASYRYKKCQRVADVFLDHDLKRFNELFESGLESIEDCSRQEEAALAGEVKLALARASAQLSDQIKDLHAYTVASLRALTNFHQSAIEARQARAERSAGIDERTTRVELEL
jgi:hypothetical protein